MTKSLPLITMLGGFAGYVIAKLIGITDGFVIFVIAVVVMMITGIGGLVVARRARSNN